MESLSKFSSQSELRQMLDDLFDVIDADKNGELDVEEAHAGLENLVQRRLASDAWGFKPGGKIGRDAFADIMRNELRQYTQRQIVNAMGSEANASSYELHMGIKLLLDAQENPRQGDGTSMPERSGAGLEDKINEQLEQMRRDQSLMRASIQQLCQTQNELLQKVDSQQQTLSIKPHRALKTINPLPARVFVCGNLIENLEKLAALRVQGALTEDEFANAKAAAMAQELRCEGNRRATGEQECGSGRKQ